MTLRTHALAVAILAGAIAAAAWLLSSLSGAPLVGYDDANIFFVYARNLLNGDGFVYYPGGERVEGFTSLSWVLICAAAMAMSSRFEMVLFALNCVVLAGAMWSLCCLIERIGRQWWPAIALTAAVTFTPGSMAWNVVSLMDSGLWSSLMLLTSTTLIRAALTDSTAFRMLPLLIAALALTRPEALLYGPMFIGLGAGILLLHGIAPAAALRTMGPSMLSYVAAVGAMLAWRLSYFGYPFPNTYYAKTGDPLIDRVSDGAGYLLDFAVSNPAVPIMIAAGIGTSIVTRRRRQFAAGVCLLVMMAAGCAIPVINGGDHFGFWRMFQPVAPLVAIQAVLTASAVAVNRTHGRRLAAAVCALSLAAALVPWRHWTMLGELTYPSSTAPGGAANTPRVEIAIAEDMRGIGEAFTRAFPDVKPRVGVIVAGGFAFAYDGPTIDLMGLNNVAMAHSPGPRVGMRNHAAFSQDVFFRLAPDVVLLSLWSPGRPDWFGFPMLSGVFAAPPSERPDYFARRAVSMDAFDAGVLKGLLRNQRISEYAWASVRPSRGREWIHAVFNRGFLDRLRQSGYEVVMPAPRPA